MKIEDKWIQETYEKGQKKTKHGGSKAKTAVQGDTPKPYVRKKREGAGQRPPQPNRGNHHAPTVVTTMGHGGYHSQDVVAATTMAAAICLGCFNFLRGFSVFHAVSSICAVNLS